MVTAFAGGGYEKGLKPAVVATVPEPSAVLLLALGLAIALGHRRRPSPQ
jgi:hypothetical protein